jgi:hypothetical protein
MSNFVLDGENDKSLNKMDEIYRMVEKLVDESNKIVPDFSSVHRL